MDEGIGTSFHQIDGAATVLHNLFENNDVVDGAAISSIGGELLFRHDIVRGGTVATLIRISGPDAEVTNNVLYNIQPTGSDFARTGLHLASVDFLNNILSSVHLDDFTEHEAEYCLFHDYGDADLYYAGDSVPGDPKFTDAEAGDFALRVGYSPAIAAGSPSRDFDDVDGTRDDMGEYGGPRGGGRLAMLYRIEGD